MGAFKIFRKFSQLLDRTTVDLPAINTPLADALDAKANSADLGSIATFEGDQNLRTTDPATFTDLTASGTVTAGTITANGNLTVNPTGAVKVEKSGTPQFTFGGGSGNYTYRDFYTISGNQLGLSGLRWGSAWMTNIDASGTVSAADVSATGNIQATTKLTVGTGLDFITGRTDYGIGVVLSTVSGNRRNLFVGKGLLDEGAVVMRAGGFLGWSGNFANADFSVGDLRLYRHGISELGIGTATTTNGGSLSLANLTASGTVTAGVAGAGSYLTPTLTVGDANTGFYHSATNRMGFSVAATKCFNIYSRGLYMETGFALGASSSQWMRSGASGIEFASLNTGGSLIDISMANLTASGTVTAGGNVSGNAFIPTGVISGIPATQAVGLWYGSLAMFSGGGLVSTYALGGINHSAAVKLSWNNDTSLSRISAGIIGLGTGTPGSTAGSLSLANLTASGTVTTPKINNLSGNLYCEIAGPSNGLAVKRAANPYAGAVYGSNVYLSRFSILTWNGSSNQAQADGGLQSDITLQRESSGILLMSGTEFKAPNLTASGTVKTGSLTVAVATASSSATAVAAGAGASVYITDETGGATLAVSDGTVWRRVSDRASIS